MVRTDRDNDMFRDTDGLKLRQLEDILRTYLMYNVDLGKERRGSHDYHVTMRAVMCLFCYHHQVSRDCHVTMMECHVTFM